MYESKNVPELRSWHLFTEASIQSAKSFTERADPNSEMQAERRGHIDKLIGYARELEEKKESVFKKS